MARNPDWAGLLKETVLAVDGEEVKGLYSIHWRDAGTELTADFRDAIDREPKRWKRAVMTANAGLYGLTRRLSPPRRLLFAFAFLLALWGAFHVFSSADWPDRAVASVIILALAFALLLALIGMELVDKLRFRDELVLARELQAEIVPNVLPQVAGYELGAFNRVANTVGGDLYEFAPLDGGRLAILFGDASGHGMAAGLVMAIAHTAWRVQLGVDPSPAAVATTLNQVLCRTGACGTQGARSFFAGIPFLFDTGGRFTAVVAGHPPILRVDRQGRIVERIGKGAYPLGIKQAIVPEVYSGILGDGELLVFHSDGLTEARSAAGEEFGDARVAAVLLATAGATAAAVSIALSGSLFSFLKRVPPDDDVSVAVVRRLPVIP
jgi:serine phosphatase RsbU (regulator of sigma subunit)